MSVSKPIRFARLSVMLLFCFASAGFGAEIVTDEPLRLQVLRTEFPRATISTGHRAEKRPQESLAPEMQPLWDVMKDALVNETEYQVVGPVEKEEEGPAEIVIGSKEQRFTDKRRVRLLLYRWRSKSGDSSSLLAILNYSFPEAIPARCCRAIGKVLLLSSSGDHVLAKVDQMPNAFTTFTAVKFLDAGSTGNEKLLIGVDFAGAGTVGMNSAVFDLSNQKLRALGWITTAIYFGLEREEEVMFTTTLDEQRTRLSKENRVWFVKKTYIAKGKKFPKPITSNTSIRLNSKGVPLDWLKVGFCGPRQIRCEQW